MAGLPKCMVQSVGGILLNHIKELRLHTDVKREDRLFYYTTCGWMMWNWMVSALSLGTTIILFDGSPFHPDPGALFRLVEEEKITIFGTSAKYIDSIRNEGLKPIDKYDIQNLKTILSTGSPLTDENFRFVYSDIKEDVCLSPFPSMPLYFWDDPSGEKYRNAYFDVYPCVWRHGDFIEINDRGGVLIFGRYDTTLNPGGVRIGTAEIYRVRLCQNSLQSSP